MYEENIKLPEGLSDFLESLKPEFKVGVATSAPHENLVFVLEKVGLQDYFEAKVDSSMCERGKPSPDIYLAAAEELGVSPGRCVAIEDSNAGMKAARAAGMKVVAITTTISRNEIKDADLIIDNFSELSVEDVDELLE